MANIYAYRLKILKFFGLWSLVFGLSFLSCILIIVLPVFAQDKSPKRIISLGPAITRNLSLLGVEDKIIGVTTYCNIPQLDSRERVGTLMETDLEKIMTLKPDLVIATSLTNEKTMQTLKSLGIRTMVLDEPENFNHLCAQFLSLAKLVNRERVGREIVSIAKEKAADLKDKVNSASRPKVIVQIGANPLWVATRKSLVNDFVEMAGGEHIGPPGKSGLISREYVLKYNPDVIIIIDMGIIAEEEKTNWEKFDTINAVINKRIHILDSYAIGSPTPASFVDTLKEIFQLLYL